MKKLIFIFAFLISSTSVFAQYNDKIFSSSEIIWCGLDYSMVKCIGAEGFSNPSDITDRMFNAWNSLMISEGDKYNFGEAYQKDSQKNDLSVVVERNKLPKADDLVMLDGENKISNAQLKEIISTYDLEKHKQGLGLVYVVEELNKITEQMSIHLVFFDISTKEIMYTKNYKENARGFGFRNYWARPILETIVAEEKVYKKAYKAYKKR